MMMQTNLIHNATSEDMHHLSDESVHLVVTSPPYNVEKDYELGQTFDDWEQMLSKVWAECLRVLVPGGRLCVNVANTGRKPYVPLNAYITMQALQLGFLMRGEIIWDKGASAGKSAAWGSWMSASNPILRDVHEYIMVFSKDDYQRGAPKTGNPL